MSEKNDTQLIGFDLHDGRHYLLVSEGGPLSDPNTVRKMVPFQPTYLSDDAKPRLHHLDDGETRYLLASTGSMVLRISFNEMAGYSIEPAGRIPEADAPELPYLLGYSNKGDDDDVPSPPEARKKPAKDIIPVDDAEDAIIAPRFEPINEEALATARRKLAALEDMQETTAAIERKISYARRQRELAELGHPDEEPIALHLVLTGNPGVGKTTIARIYGEILHALGLLKKGHLVETDESGLVAGYVGQTAIKTSKKCDEAMDGVLYIDEAHNLMPAGGNDFRPEALGVLTKRMEDNRHRLAIVLSGYREPLETLVSKTKGWSSRFKTFINIKDPSLEALQRIFNGMAEERHLSVPEDTARTAFDAIARRKSEMGSNFENGREIRNMIESAVEHLSARTQAKPGATPIMQMTPAQRSARLKELTTLRPEDFEQPSHAFKPEAGQRNGIGFMASVRSADAPSPAATARPRAPESSLTH